MKHTILAVLVLIGFAVAPSASALSYAYPPSNCTGSNVRCNYSPYNNTARHSDPMPYYYGNSAYAQPLYFPKYDYFSSSRYNSPYGYGYNQPYGYGYGYEEYWAEEWQTWYGYGYGRPQYGCNSYYGCY